MEIPPLPCLIVQEVVSEPAVLVHALIPECREVTLSVELLEDIRVDVDVVVDRPVLVHALDLPQISFSIAQQFDLPSVFGQIGFVDLLFEFVDTLALILEMSSHLPLLSRVVKEVGILVLAELGRHSGWERPWLCHELVLERTVHRFLLFSLKL